MAQVQHRDILMTSVWCMNKSSNDLFSPPSAIRSSNMSNPPFGNHDFRWSDSGIPSLNPIKHSCSFFKHYLRHKNCRHINKVMMMMVVNVVGLEVNVVVVE